MPELPDVEVFKKYFDSTSLNKKIKNDDNLDWTDDFFLKCFKLTPNNSGSMFFCSHHSIGPFTESAKKAGFEIVFFESWPKALTTGKVNFFNRLWVDLQRKYCLSD
mgnify:CR=1 FL=1